MASSKETYCLCGQPYNLGQFMIECDCCREWFHGSCVDVKIYHSDDIDKYHCPKCAQTYGPSVLKIPTNNHRADRYEIGAETRPSQAGTPAWVRALAARPLRPTSASLQRMRPQHFTEEFVRDNGFTRPVIFNTTEGLDMKIPNPATFNVRSVLRYCGAQLEVEVIDVRRQTTLRMPLADFVEYFETPPELRDDKVLNVLSLEFTDTNMCNLVDPPGITRRLDWAQNVWPASGEPARPAVQRYCLMSARASYTDFHVDFGGTTVWYHVLHGRKIFYLIPPTTTNLALYQQWSAANNQSERFFGDMVEWYGTAELGQGETLFIPTGWIHAVYTPCDSLVFGGNLLHSYAIEMQLQIYEIEGRVETPMMFRYPLFEALHWYAAAQLLTTLRRHNEETQDEDFTLSESCVSTPPAELPPLLLRGIKILSSALKEWHALKSSDSSKRDNVPKCLNSGQLVRELCKELRLLEKRSSSTKDKDLKVKNHSPNKSQSKKQATPKKSLKLTLPKPIMHMQPNANGDFEEKVYADKFYIDSKEVVYPERYIQDVKYVTSDVKYVNSGVKYVDNGVKYIDSGVKYVDSGVKYVDSDVKYVDPNVKYLDANVKYVDNGVKYVEGDVKIVTDDVKYVNGVPDIKYGLEKDFSEKYAYQNYDEVAYQDGNGYVDRQDKKVGLKIKLNNSPSSSREEPPPYSLPEHSILKSHLIRTERALKPLQQWTISKKDIGDYHEEQILFTNENLPNIRPEGQEMNYGAGMYSAEDMQHEYQYGDTARAGYQQIYQQPELAYSEPAYQRYPEVEHQQAASYSGDPAYAHTQLPSYDAAVAHQFHTTNYVVEEQKPVVPTPPANASPLPVRRSERPVRRRVSSTYEYEDADLYIDEAPPPTRRRAAKPKHQRHHAHRNTASNSSAYRQQQQAAQQQTPQPPPARPVPANGIESLIQASVLAEDQPVNDTEDAAVAGMLSIGEQRFEAPPRTFGLAVDTPQPTTDTSRVESSSGGSRSRSRKAASSADDDDYDEEDVIKEVHRDEEYVYPSLEMSSDEDEDWSVRRRRAPRNRTDSRSKTDKDESWSPRARLGRVAPRLRGPARSAVRRECVRAALHAAAISNAQDKHDKHKDHAVHDKHHPQSAKRAVLATKSKRPPPPVHTPQTSKNMRLKKGMKTAKQRLGKILKIHKMIY
ncbi:lysine-specific demethylase phf2-like [Maniola hyperantus]|uniref:lysine-specific demethylase phf2-like n=1 Tax=Aphantopus hyperantus TaxID=2795564 RepID=UPI0015688F09|nr:histone lysine demethylase PHF8-like [Maniola hyperantus]